MTQPCQENKMNAVRVLAFEFLFSSSWVLFLISNNFFARKMGKLEKPQ